MPSGLSIQQKYNTPQAEAYRGRLSALVEGRSAPSLPQWDPSCMQASSGGSSSAGSSFNGDSKGVEALKGESESDYVARQMQLRDEARARMQAKFGSGGMQGIGSGGETRAPQSSGGVDLSSAFGYLSSTVSSVASTATNIVRDKDLGSKVSSGWSMVQSKISDPALTDNVKSTASTGWSVLSSGASAVWKSAQTVVESTVGNGSGGGNSYNGSNGFPSQFPRTNANLPSSSKYEGMGSTTSSRNHDNDSWLDSQLGSGSSSSGLPKASSFGGSATNAFSSGAPLSSSSHSSSFTSSSSSSMSLSSTATPMDNTPAPVVAAPPPAPVPAPAKPVKKDVDFFGEFGF